MIRKTMKMLAVALIAAFALSSTAVEAAAPKRTRHRAKHSSRVASGAAATIGKKPATKKKAATAKAGARTKAAAKAPAAKKAPAKRRPATKPR